jgi:hypothetical protein
MTFLKDETWSGQVFAGGWITPEGGDAAVIEPATGRELGRVGIARSADVTRAVQKASAAQPAWAATPHTERSAILRRAAQLWEENAAEIEGWVIRESGKVGPAAQFETHVSVQEIYQAATLPSRPYGELLPSEQPRLSWAERVPVGVVGVIAPFNFPQILSVRSVAPALALGNAVVLKPDPRAHQRADGGRRAQRPLRRHLRLGHRHPLRRHRQPRRLHRDPLGNRPPRDRPLPVLSTTGQAAHAPVRNALKPPFRTGACFTFTAAPCLQLHRVYSCTVTALTSV